MVPVRAARDDAHQGVNRGVISERNRRSAILVAESQQRFAVQHAHQRFRKQLRFLVCRLRTRQHCGFAVSPWVCIMLVRQCSVRTSIPAKLIHVKQIAYSVCYIGSHHALGFSGKEMFRSYWAMRPMLLFALLTSIPAFYLVLTGTNALYRMEGRVPPVSE